MSRLNELHDQAMDLADQAFIARHSGNKQLADDLARHAFELEAKAADLVKDDLSAEPTRSVLYRSAASLALQCQEEREAERLVATALVGNPPVEIAEELRDLLEQVNFKRHLSLRNVTLDPSELQLSIAGNLVGLGIALSETLIERVKDFERLIYRTVERKLGEEFRERGAAKRAIQEGYSLWITAPRPASLSITLRLGRQMELPGFDISSEVIDDLMECFELLNTAQEDQLRQKIPQDTYYQNFVALAKRIAPDGERVNLVGLTRLKDGIETQVRMTRKQREITYSPQKTKQEKPRKIVSVTGRLLLADATKAKRRIKLIDEGGITHNIIVPDSMMDDIVKPLWDDIVTVTGPRIGPVIYLNEISRVAD